jgi:hypothetical protein
MEESEIENALHKILHAVRGLGMEGLEPPSIGGSRFVCASAVTSALGAFVAGRWGRNRPDTTKRYRVSNEQEWAKIAEAREERIRARGEDPVILPSRQGWTVVANAIARTIGDRPEIGDEAQSALQVWKTHHGYMEVGFMRGGDLSPPPPRPARPAP